MSSGLKRGMGGGVVLAGALALVMVMGPASESDRPSLERAARRSAAATAPLEAPAAAARPRPEQEQPTRRPAPRPVAPEEEQVVDLGELTPSAHPVEMAEEPEHRPELSRGELVQAARGHLARVFGRVETGPEGSAAPGRPVGLRLIDALPVEGGLLVRFDAEAFGYQTLMTVMVSSTGEIDREGSTAPFRPTSALVSPEQALGAATGLGQRPELALVMDSRTHRLAWRIRDSAAPTRESLGRRVGLLIDLQTGEQLAEERWATAMGRVRQLERQLVYPRPIVEETK